VARNDKCDVIFNNHFTANLLQNVPVKKIENQLRFDKIVAMNLWPHFCPAYKFARRCCGFTAERSAGRRCLSIAARRSAENAGSATLTADIGS